MLGALMAFPALSIDMYLPAFPALAQDLQATPGQVPYTLSAFFLGLALGQLLHGPLADRLGRKPPLLLGILLYVLASLGCAMAPGIEALTAWRFLQAVGGCAGMVVARAVVRDLCEPTAAARIFSWMMLVMGLAPILAPLGGGWLLELADWRAIFWFLAAFGLACLVAVTALLPETLPPAGRVPLSPGGVARVYGRLLQHRRFMAFALAGTCCSAGMFAYIAGSPHVFITLYGVPANQYGLYFGANAVGLIALSQLNRGLVTRYGVEAVLGAGITGAALLGLVLWGCAWTGLGGFWGLLVPLFGYVAMMGLISPNGMALALGSQRSHHGQASALLGTVQFTLATGSGLLVGALPHHSARPMTTLMALFGLAGLTAFTLARRTAPDADPASREGASGEESGAPAPGTPHAVAPGA
ncbi:MAG: Bcr/CflA family multidrug efflux MFS transporter [Candidatus Sericytochromatia bacterium]|nr:Bcr/CflA family multidrug efflux MFS transporter [Candidatus Sericytochromatia bacterium]